MRARVGIAIFLAGLAAVMAVACLIPVPAHSAELIATPKGTAPPAPAPDTARMPIPVPDCATVFCVVPRPVMERHQAEDAVMAAEIERLRAEVAELRKSKTVKCGIVERTS